MKKRILALVLSLAMVLTILPTVAFAAEGDGGVPHDLALMQGDVVESFVPAGTVCESSDESVAWVDENGNLNALKTGYAEISSEAGNCSVYVYPYEDGSEVVGNLKILARFNDSMQFYDGHVYLLFTSYQDGVSFNVPDLYGQYEISRQYYNDIDEDIANGSNHTGSDTEQYFTFRNDLAGATINRGDIVTIGMYRGFDLSVKDAVIGCFKNSSAWTKLIEAGKAEVIDALFNLFKNDPESSEETFSQIVAVLQEVGIDPSLLADGVVEGGVCFNRELYNQKLEWDQFENVTYELDITKKQLDAMIDTLPGNLDDFSILKNSCATVAVKAWNAAVGTRNGVDTAYKLSAEGDGIFAYMDAPKSVRDNIRERLKGYYLNNSEAVNEPGAGFQDETGWVYVSAPEKVTPVTYTYEDPSLQIDTEGAVYPSPYPYVTPEPEVAVEIERTTEGEITTVTGVTFDNNGQKYSPDPAEGIWFKTFVGQIEEGKTCYVTDAAGVALPSIYDYEDGWISFYTERIPFTYQVVGGGETAKNILRSSVDQPDRAEVETEIYIMDEEGKQLIGNPAELTSGTRVYIKPKYGESDFTTTLKDIKVNYASIMIPQYYDTKEEAYFFDMPEMCVTLQIAYATAEVKLKEKFPLQVSVGDVLEASDFAEVLTDDNTLLDTVEWEVINDEEYPDDIIFEYVDDLHTKIKVLKEGMDVVFLQSKDKNCFRAVLIEAYEDTSDMVAVLFDEENSKETSFRLAQSDRPIRYSGYKVKPGTEILVKPSEALGEGHVISSITCNGVLQENAGPITINEDTEIKATWREAEIVNLPRTITLASEDDTYKLDAQVRYKGLFGLFEPVFDPTVHYESSDPLVEVADNGLVTVNGEIPEEGCAVIVKAYSGDESQNVMGECKVVLGNYQGEKIVGRMTILARRIAEEQLVHHSMVAFTTYDDLDLNVSYFHFYEPNEKYADLMKDYEDHPENYPSDPALYSEEIPIEDRESYFDISVNGVRADAKTISLKTGETISVSNYPDEDDAINYIIESYQGSTLEKNSEAARELVALYKQYAKGEEIDKSLAFDDLVEVVKEIVQYSAENGENPLDGDVVGGLFVNREMYNQFRRSDSQLPNNYYTIEITADELANMKSYLADPENNYYQLFNKNCASGASDLWNATLADRPGLQLKANPLAVVDDPMSLYAQLGALRFRYDLGGYGGTNFYPRTVESRHKWFYVPTEKGLEKICINNNIEHYCGNCPYHGKDAPIQIPDGWFQIDGDWYYFIDNVPQQGWVYDNASWYYLDPETFVMQTGWQNIDGFWYYLSASGAMVTGWAKINNVWYFLKGTGQMAENEWIEGYWLGADGAWTYNAIGSWKQDANGWWFGDTTGWYAKDEIVTIDYREYPFNAAGYLIQLK